MQSSWSFYENTCNKAWKGIYTVSGLANASYMLSSFCQALEMLNGIFKVVFNPETPGKFNIYFNILLTDKFSKAYMEK